MNKKFVLFDFDGVIVDSWGAAFETNKLMCPNLTENDYKKAFEGNISDWDNSSVVHTEQCQHDLNFFEAFIPRLMAQATVFPGMEDAIKELANDYTLIIISSTISAPINDLLNKFGLSSFFTEIFGNDVHASKVEKIKMIFAKYNIVPEDCVFITDTLGDMREAKKCNVKSIGVNWGFHNKETLLHGEPIKIISTASDLIPTVKECFKNLSPS